jgi:hypothetical protein
MTCSGNKFEKMVPQDKVTLNQKKHALTVSYLAFLTRVYQMSRVNDDAVREAVLFP